MTEIIELQSDLTAELFGSFNENVKLIENLLDVSIKSNNGGITIEGEAEKVKSCRVLLDSLLMLLSQGYPVTKAKVRSSIDLIMMGKPEEIINLSKDTVTITAKGKQVKCKTIGQRDYVKAIKSHTLSFGVGPAGTGKTYLAVALAAAAYKSGEVEKIILTRPAIEAGEKLGFLPGDLQTKVDPYLRPLYDGLSEMFGLDSYQKLIERGVIEVAPLAYMRGRTLSNAFIILDEAQNTTAEQMKMFLTRIGEGSRVVVTGDETQIDLPDGKQSGLKQAVKILKGIDDIAVVRLSAKDVVRHELVQRIIGAYEKMEKRTVAPKTAPTR